MPPEIKSVERQLVFSDADREVFEKLAHYVQARHYRGQDPYDGLNSKLLRALPLYRIPFVRLCVIQFFKRCPVNLRSAFFVPEGFNAKAGALFLTGNCKMYSKTKDNQYRMACENLAELIKREVLLRKKGNAWGYNFDWQAKAFFVPQGTPNMVTSVYVGHALMDYAEAFDDNEARDLAVGVSQYILNEMILWENDAQLCFAYIPGRDAEVHNANLMAASFLSRINPGDDRVAHVIEKAVSFSIKDIKRNGYWAYGTKLHHRWMDNFHTAFNLEALLAIRKNLKTKAYDEIIIRVFRYYLEFMFLVDGTPKYYNDKLYPIDIHTIAESIIFLSKVIGDDSGLFDEKDVKHSRQLMHHIVELAYSTMRDPHGYFYYQRTKWYTNRIPYMRWSQAWMFYALSCYGATENAFAD